MGREQPTPTSIATQGAKTRMALNLRPEGAVSAASVATVARRYWWVSTLIFLLVGLAAGGRFLTAPRAYLASQSVTFALIPAQKLGDPVDAALATSYAQAIARSVVSGKVVTTDAFASAALARVPAETAQRENITKAKMQKALSATAVGGQAQLEANWPTEPGARAIVSAAVLALQANPQIPAYALNPGDSVAAQIAPTEIVVKQDPQRQADVFNAFIQQVTVGLAIALALPWVFAGLTRGGETGDHLKATTPYSTP
jgi:hypothetical protein